MKTSVDLKTSDSLLADLYKTAETVLKNNERDFAGRTVLIE
jgi:hypothetical protein